MSPWTVAAVLLAASMAGNIFLGHAYLGQRDTAVKVKTETVYVTAAAKECSKGTDALVTKAEENKAVAAPKVAAAASAAQAHNKRADAILAAPPAVPGDACKSAEAVLDQWWQGRAKP